MCNPPPLIPAEMPLSILMPLIVHYPLVLVAMKGNIIGIIIKADIISSMAKL